MTDERADEYDLFISYTHTDEEWAKKLAARVERERWGDRNLRVFFAPWDIRPGESVDQRLDRALAESRYLGLILSPEAVKSEWVSEEWYSTHHAGMKRKERRIIPLYLRACDIPPFIAHLNRIDFRDDDKFEEGVHRLLAVLRDEPLPRGDRDEAPKGTLPPSYVPRPPSFGFVARRDAQGRDIVERLRAELAPRRDRLVTLSGPGGIGKTTLAAQAARELQETYGRHVVWSSADGRADFNFLSLLDDISTQLGRADLRTLAPAEKAEQVRALVAGALVVLDNYETVAEAERARIEAWLKLTPCSALFTSRPRVTDTVFVPVSAMSREEAEEFLERLAMQTQDSQLFTPEVRESIYKTADANPYVMQWVVAQIDNAQEAATVLKELSEGEGDAAERVFARSFNLPQLGEDGRDTLLALSLFAPSASREALAAVAGLGKDRKGLDDAVRHLHAMWLVKGVNGNRRLAVEGLTRTLAAARLSKDLRAEEFRHRFVNYFLRYAEERRDPTPENYDALEEDKDNLLGAAETAFASGDWESVMRMAYALARPADGMLSVRGYWDETVRLGEQALQAARSSQNDAEIANHSHNVALIYRMRGEFMQAGRLYNDSLKIKKKQGNHYGVAITLHELGNIAYVQGQLEEAKQLYGESLEIKKRHGNQLGVANSLHQLGMIARVRGDMEEAWRLYGESLEIRKKLGAKKGIAESLHELGNIAQVQADLDRARQLYSESLEIETGLGNQDGIATTLHELGNLAEREGNKIEAARLFREALGIFERLGSPNAEIARKNLARVEGEAS